MLSHVYVGYLGRINEFGKKIKQMFHNELASHHSQSVTLLRQQFTGQCDVLLSVRVKGIIGIQH